MGGVSGPERAFLLGLLAFTLFGSGVRWLSARHPERFPLSGDESTSVALEDGPVPSLASEVRQLAGPLTLLELQRARVEEAVRRASPGGSRSASRSGEAAAGPPVDVNRASAAELEALPGVGPAIAQRIVEDRERRGPYRTLGDLARVKGIGPRTIERIGAAATAGSVQNALAGGDLP